MTKFNDLNHKQVLLAVLAYFGDEVEICEDCLCVCHAGYNAHGEDGIDICPECRSFESFIPLEAD